MELILLGACEYIKLPEIQLCKNGEQHELRTGAFGRDQRVAIRQSVSEQVLSKWNAVAVVEM